jgi:hypothetical protein
MLSSIRANSHLRTAKIRLPSPKTQYNINGIDKTVLEVMAQNIMLQMEKKDIDVSMRTALKIINKNDMQLLKQFIGEKPLYGGKSLHNRFRNKTIKKISGGNKSSFNIFVLTIIICLIFFIRPITEAKIHNLTRGDIEKIIKLIPINNLLDESKYVLPQDLTPIINIDKSKSKNAEPIADVITVKNMAPFVVINNEFLTGITRTDTPDFEKLIIKIDETVREEINNPDPKIETILKIFSISKNIPQWKDGFNYLISLRPNTVVNNIFSMDEALDKLLTLDFKFAKAIGFGDKIHKIEFLKTLLSDTITKNSQNLIRYDKSIQSKSIQHKISAQVLFDTAILISRDNIAIGIINEAKQESIPKITNTTDSEFLQSIYNFIKSIYIIAMFIGSAGIYMYKNRDVFEESVIQKLENKEKIISDWKNKSKKIQEAAAEEEKQKKEDFLNTANEPVRTSRHKTPPRRNIPLKGRIGL